MLEVLRPPPHRGPLIAAGAVVLAVGIALEELRLRDEVGAGVHLAIVGLAAAVVLALGLQAPNEGGRPPAYQSVLLVTGLLLLYAALLRLADVLGADFGGDFPAGAFAWTGAVHAAAAAWASVRRRSAVCGLLAAIAAGIALLSAWELIFDPEGFTAARWLLLAMALGLVLGALALRARVPRHAELLIAAAGLAILVIGLQGLVGAALDSFLAFGGAQDAVLPDPWELVVLAGGCGLVAYGAVDRAPGPAWLGVANLLVFVLAAGLGDATLYWWPLLVLALGAGAMAVGLRPRDPLPPEPDAYGAGDRPLASRAADDELVVRVRDDSPPPAGSVPE